MGFLGHSNKQAFKADKKDSYLELDSKRLLLRLHVGALQKVIVPVAKLRGYRLLQDDEVILEAQEHKQGYSKDNLLPVITQFSQPDDGSEWPTELYHLDLDVLTSDETYRLRLIDTRTPIKSMTYSDAVLDAERAILALDGLLDE
ncbi:hypothetical protein [Lacticaseibacillus zhaodongensis]|uniref:hypothetical protein n=1 Tax=Lacticaseibacillus zhaodongensis TaxID=2668065 RepID=UPI0012D3666F|nr:hypothetical protein [Lacticaseibacillus zhaodongensis]